jgi:protocatechuate 3,4-dioxygenase beta subunit
MRTTSFGLAMPILLLLAATFAMVAPQASAQETFYAISGHVVSDTGVPIEGVRVSGYTYSDDPSSGEYRNSEVITDADGLFKLDLAPGKGYLNVYYDEWRQGDGREIVVTDADQTDLVFTLKTPPPKTAIVSGTVLDPVGNPVEGATVTLQYACCYAMPATAETPPEPAPVAEPTSPQDANTTTSDPGSTGCTPEECGVTDAKMVRPSVMPPSYDDYATATTSADGRFSFKAYSGSRQITAWAKGYAQTSVDVIAVENEETDITVQLEKVPAKDAVLVGRVVNAVTGLPIGNAQVSVRSLEWGRYADARTEADGSYRITTLPGWTEISVNVYDWYAEPMPMDATTSSSDAAIRIAEPTGKDQYFQHTSVVKLASGDNELDTKLTPKPKPTLALIGYVVDPDAKVGVEGVHVNVWNQQTGDWGEAVTDDTGSFKILVSPGHYSGNVWKDGYLGGSQTFFVTDEAIQRVDFILPKGTTKWAPCYEDSDCGPILYAAEMSKSSGSGGVASDGATATSQGAPSYAPSARTEESQAPPVASSTSGDVSSGDGPDKSRAATFSGSGGGLPAYDPDETGVPVTPGVSQGGATEVPGLGLVALLAVGAMGALAIRRRK